MIAINIMRACFSKKVAALALAFKQVERREKKKNKNRTGKMQLNEEQATTSPQLNTKWSPLAALEI